MRRPNAAPRDLQRLLERADARPVSSEDRERQIVSFAYGNVRMEDERVTRALIEHAARATMPKK
jgi:hypothetical protein